MLKSESFLDLRWPLVLALVREEDLQVDEVDLFNAVRAWVSRNPAERRGYVDEVRRSFELRSPMIRLQASFALPHCCGGCCSVRLQLDPRCFCRRLRGGF